MVSDKRKHIPIEQIDEKSVNWVLDTSFFRSNDTKYMKLVELYWVNKSFISQVIEEQGKQQQEILSKLDQMGKKYEAIWGIEIVMENMDDER